MTREQARREIDSLDFYLQNHTDDYGEESHTAMKMAIKALSSAEKLNEWIPVTERLPEAGEYVGDVARYYLVQNEYGDMLVARYTHSGYWRQIYQLKPIGDEIVAWMPLPQKYKEEIPTVAEGSDKDEQG